MARIKEKKERALGAKLFLKAERCNSHKCVMVRRPYRPGQHGQKRKMGRMSDFGKQLQEKQKIQITYNLTNKQMRKIFRKHAGDPSQIVSTLEKRLDRVVYLLGFAASSRVGRQIVSHGHIMVNGKKMAAPSYQVEKGDEITIRPQSKDKSIFNDLEEKLKKYEVPEWLELNKKELKGKCVDTPPEDAILPFDVNLVGEFYNR